MNAGNCRSPPTFERTKRHGDDLSHRRKYDSAIDFHGRHLVRIASPRRPQSRGKLSMTLTTRRNEDLDISMKSDLDRKVRRGSEPKYCKASAFPRIASLERSITNDSRTKQWSSIHLVKRCRDRIT